MILLPLARLWQAPVCIEVDEALEPLKPVLGAQQVGARMHICVGVTRSRRSRMLSLESRSKRLYIYILYTVYI